MISSQETTKVDDPVPAADVTKNNGSRVQKEARVVLCE